MKLRWLFILLITPFQLSAQQSEEVFLKTDSAEIAGTLLLPKAQIQPFPVVLIIAGSGPTDRNGNNPSMVNNSLKMVAEGLTSHGIASLRFDKRGVGASSTQKTEIDLRFEDFVHDVEALYDFLVKDQRFSEVYILGHSEGSLIGMIVAHNVDATGFISIAGAGFPAADILRKQFGNQP